MYLQGDAMRCSRLMAHFFASSFLGSLAFELKQIEKSGILDNTFRNRRIPGFFELERGIAMGLGFSSPTRQRQICSLTLSIFFKGPQNNSRNSKTHSCDHHCLNRRGGYQRNYITVLSSVKQYKTCLFYHTSSKYGDNYKVSPSNRYPF